jgi:ABC-type multidrug transport system fused ATPase/permease subunit
VALNTINHKPLLITGNLSLPDSWPDKGEITFDKVYLRYDSHLEPVVLEASFTIKSGEKVNN